MVNQPLFLLLRCRESLGIASISLTPSLEENTAVLFFWERNFSGAESVTWSQFKGEFHNQYGDELDKAYDKKEQEWLLEILYKELVEDDESDEDVDLEKRIEARRRETERLGLASSDAMDKGDQLVQKAKYEEYCKVDGEMQPFWVRLQDQAMEKSAIMSVFGIDSNPTLRLKAVENLAKYKSTAVLDALVDLLGDDDPNVRAIAAISISKCGVGGSPANSFGAVDNSGTSTTCRTSFDDIDDTLLKLLLEDKDRLVRESVCIAFAYRRNRKMIPHLVQVWRNDNISSVRDAAQAALKNIGGEEADRAIQMTKILQDEMKALVELSA